MMLLMMAMKRRSNSMRGSWIDFYTQMDWDRYILHTRRCYSARETKLNCYISFKYGDASEVNSLLRSEMFFIR